MPRMGFEPKNSVFERAKRFRAWDRSATVIGASFIHVSETLSYATLYALLHTYEFSFNKKLEGKGPPLPLRLW
jgi:hypothetical protein